MIKVKFIRVIGGHIALLIRATRHPRRVSITHTHRTGRHTRRRVHRGRDVHRCCRSETSLSHTVTHLGKADKEGWGGGGKYAFYTSFFCLALFVRNGRFYVPLRKEGPYVKGVQGFSIFGRRLTKGFLPFYEFMFCGGIGRFYRKANVFRGNNTSLTQCARRKRDFFRKAVRGGVRGQRGANRGRFLKARYRTGSQYGVFYGLNARRKGTRRFVQLIEARFLGSNYLGPTHRVLLPRR